MYKFTVNDREFVAHGSYTFQHVFRDFNIRVVRMDWSDLRRSPTRVDEWTAEQIADGKTYYLTGYWPTPEEAARQALSVWAADIEESDRADAVDADRERREYVRDNQLRKSDVI